MDWAEERALGWLEEHWPGLEELGCDTTEEDAKSETQSLAALLREVQGIGSVTRRDTLAEVRRVVEEEGARDWDYQTVLSRLEKL